MRAPDGTDGRILIRDTWNTEIVDGLKPQSGDIILYKTRFSGFYQTGLDNILKTLNARYLRGHRMHYQRVRGIYRQGRDVQRLFLLAPRRLHGRADRKCR